MKRRSSSVDVGGDSSLELQDPDAEPEDRLNGLISRHSSTLDRQLSSLYSNSNSNSNANQANGHQQHPPSHAAIASFSPLSLPTSSPSMTTTKQPPSAALGARSRGLWFLSILCFLVATAGVGLLVAIFRSLTTRQIEPKGCRMSYMRPSYIHFSEFDTEHTRFASKYSLYLYREQGIDGGQVGSVPPYSEKQTQPSSHTTATSCAVFPSSSSRAMPEATSKSDQLLQRRPTISTIIFSTTGASWNPASEALISSQSTSTRTLLRSMARHCLIKPNTSTRPSATSFRSIPSLKESLATRISRTLHQS